ncbi:MAG: DUF2071 domain-containing protein [Opitutaceae bacterium]
MPDEADRLACRKRPPGSIVGRQRWTDLLFLHWTVDPELVQSTLPPGLRVDVLAGKAYIGIVPFFMKRIRPAWLPPLPWISWFLELNVRTYVHDANGRPGVWFYSLDCNQPLAVALAKRFFHLPYFNARMSAQRSERTIRYACQRNAPSSAVSHYAWTPGTETHLAAPGTLEFFLVERYVLFSTNRSGQLHTGRVFHSPYRVHHPVVTDYSAAPAQWDGFALNEPPISVLGAQSVDVSVYSLQPVHTALL